MRKLFFVSIFVLTTISVFAQSTSDVLFKIFQQIVLSPINFILHKIFTHLSNWTREMEKCGKFSGVQKEAIIDLRLHYRTFLW